MPDFAESRETGAMPEIVWRLVFDPQRLAGWVSIPDAPPGAGAELARSKGRGQPVQGPSRRDRA